MSTRIIKINAREFAVKIVHENGVEETTQTKVCLANVTKLADSVRMLSFALNENDSASNEALIRRTLMAECGSEWLPMFTQSSGKAAHYYLVRLDVAGEFFGGLAGETIAVYGGLLFSDLDVRKDDEGNLFCEAILTQDVMYTESRERDGNSAFPREFWPGARQFRAMTLDANGNLAVISKGTAYGKQNQNAFELNDSQTKVMVDQGQWALIAPTSVREENSRQWASWEFMMLLKPTEQTIKDAVASTRDSVNGMLALLEEGNRGKLLKRFGALKVVDGKLERAKRAVLDALRSNMPMCSQLFNKLGKFMVGELIDAMLSCGVHVERHLLQMTDACGEPEVEAAEAKWLAYGLPLNHTGQVTMHRRNPKGLLQAATAKKQTRDADGDGSLSMREKWVVDAWKRGDYWSLTVPAKTKGERTHTERTVLAFIEKAIQVWKDGAWVGLLTEAQLNALYEAEVCMSGAAQAFWLGIAGELGGLAMDAPVLLKRGILGFADDANRALSMARGCERPGWRVMSNNARQECQNVYDLASRAYLIANPTGVLDNVWNVGIMAIVEWCEAHPQSSLDLVDVAALVRAHHPTFDPKSDGGALYRYRNILSMWGSYWSANYNRADHRGFWIAFEEKARKLGINGLLNLLFWKPSEKAQSDGFNLKWNAVWYSGHSWVDLLGAHPDVAQELAWAKVDAEVNYRTQVAVLGI